MTKAVIFQEEDGNGKQRLDKILASKFSGYSRTYLQQLIKNSRVKVNGIVIKEAKCQVNNISDIEIDFPPEPDNTQILPEDFKFGILYEDEDVLVIDKPAGIVVHPAAGNWSGTIVNSLLGRDENFAAKLSEDEFQDDLSRQRPGIVHRLDKDTSGCLIIAKNVRSKYSLSDSFSMGKVRKEYHAIVCGIPVRATEKITTLIGRHPINRQKMSVVQRNGKEAVTIYELMKSGKIEGYPVSLLKVNILTGRTHQIRVHLAWKNLPVLGDKVYGGSRNISAPRQMLHACRIEFPHPGTGRIVSVSSPYPEDFRKIAEAME